MSVIVNSIAIRNELSSETTDFLIGCIADKKTAYLDVTAKWGFQATRTERLYVHPNYLEIVDEDSLSTNIDWRTYGFYAGDTITLTNAGVNNGTYTIVSFDVNGSLMRFATGTFTGNTSNTATVTGITECTGLSFRYNLPENNSAVTFNSLVDGNELRFNKGALNYALYTSYTAVQQGVYNSNKQGSVIIRGYGRQYTASVPSPFVFDTTGDTITWAGGDFINEGIKVGDSIVIAGSTSNNGTKIVASVTKTVLGITTNLVNESDDNATITRLGILNRFTIEHTFYVTPLFDNSDLTDYLSGVAPNLFFNTNSPTYVYSIDLLYNLQDPNRVHSSDVSDFKIGNVGWFNENFNGDLNFYEIFSIDYSVNGVAVTNADPNQVTDFEIVVNGDSFSDTNTQFVISHFILPENSTQFKNTTTDFEANFMFDRALQTVGSAAVDGDKFGGSQQVFTNIAATFVNANQILITGKIDLSNQNKTKVAALANKRFDICITTQNYTLPTEDADLVCLKYANSQVYFSDLSNANVGGSDISFFFLPQKDIADPIKIEQTNPLSFAGWFVEDDILSRSQFFVDRTNGALIDKIDVVIKATHPTFGSFNLESRTFSFANAIQVNGVQQVNIDTTRGFTLKAADPFNIVSLNRKSSLDTGNNYYYELFYAFRLRWEYFKQLTGVSSQFFDSAEDFNGYNHDWNRYFATSGWVLEFTNDLYITENGIQNKITTTRQVTALDYGAAADWQNDLITVYGNSDNVDTLTNILTDNVSRIEAVFTYIGSTLPIIADLEGEIKIGIHEVNDINSIQRIATQWENSDNEILVSILGNNLCKKEFLGGNQFQLTCLIDNTKLTSGVQYKISARIYQTNIVPLGPDFDTDGKEFQDAEFFQFQTGEQYFFQD